MSKKPTERKTSCLRPDAGRRGKAGGRSLRILLIFLVSMSPAYAQRREEPAGKDQPASDDAAHPHQNEATATQDVPPCGTFPARPVISSQEVGKYREVLRQNPEDPVAHKRLGDGLYGQGEFEAATAEYLEALRWNRGYAEAHNGLGNTLMARSDVTGAINEYSTAIRLKPDYAEAHYNLGLALDDVRRHVPALAEYREVVRLKPDDPLGRYFLGVSLFADRDRDAAIAELRKAVKLEPRWPLAHFTLGRMLQENGKLTEATDQFRDIWVLGPNFRTILEECENLLRRTRR